jgi:curved DNA-binding protein CbpA
MSRGAMTPRLLPYSPERDVYRLLGVPSSASADEINAACRRLARTFHPDRNQSGRATEEMQVVNAVRQIMGDPDWRAIYDRERHRFHAARTIRPVEPALDPWMHRSPAALRQVTPLERYLRALAIGLRATLLGLAPPRCRGCRTVVANGDAYCVACGTPLLSGG